MPMIPAWAGWVVDGLIAITLIGFILQGIRRGLFELTLSTLMLISLLILTGAFTWAMSLIQLPYAALITVIGTAIVWIAFSKLQKRLLAGVLWDLDQRDVPAWEALLGALLGGLRGLVTVLLVGLSLVTPWRVLAPEVTSRIDVSVVWPAIAPIGRPAEGWLNEQMQQALRDAQTAGDEAGQLTQLLGRIAAAKFETDVVDSLSDDRQYDINDRAESQAESAAKVLEK